jgi:hypothetical protein
LDDLVVYNINIQFIINSKHTSYDVISAFNLIIESRHEINVKSLIFSLFNYGGRCASYTYILYYNEFVMFLSSRITW